MLKFLQNATSQMSQRLICISLHINRVSIPLHENIKFKHNHSMLSNLYLPTNTHTMMHPKPSFLITYHCRPILHSRTISLHTFSNCFIRPVLTHANTGENYGLLQITKCVALSKGALWRSKSTRKTHSWSFWAAISLLHFFLSSP